MAKQKILVLTASCLSLVAELGSPYDHKYPTVQAALDDGWSLIGPPVQIAPLPFSWQFWLSKSEDDGEDMIPKKDAAKHCPNCNA